MSAGRFLHPVDLAGEPLQPQRCELQGGAGHLAVYARNGTATWPLGFLRPGTGHPQH
jgi:hypothetical protein